MQLDPLSPTPTTQSFTSITTSMERKINNPSGPHPDSSPQKFRKNYNFFALGIGAFQHCSHGLPNSGPYVHLATCLTRKYAAIDFIHLHTGYFSNNCGGILELSVDPTPTTVNSSDNSHDTGDVDLDTVTITTAFMAATSCIRILMEMIFTVDPKNRNLKVSYAAIGLNLWSTLQYHNFAFQIIKWQDQNPSRC